MYKYLPGIDIEGSTEDIDDVVKGLNNLAKGSDTGNALIGLVARANAHKGDSLIIHKGPKKFCRCGLCQPLRNAFNWEVNTLVYDPTESMYDGSEPWMIVPSEIALGHELVHGLHKVFAIYRDSLREEELATVGLGRYAHDKFTENAIRKDMALPLRPRY